VPPRRATLCRFVRGEALVDVGLALVFRAPRSFTGEDVVELQAHGAPAVLRLLVEGVLEEPEARLAEPGEFTRRAFANGRLDLAEAEAVADLVRAESSAQVRAAAAQLSGELSRRVAALRATVLELRADAEGVLEFPDEAADADAGLADRLAEAAAALRALVADGARGALLRRGARVVLYGPVNAGKSTLFNALAGAVRAIVDAEPGTTRDALEARLELAGVPVALVDTAGFRDAAGGVEAKGIARTREELRGADLGLLICPPRAAPEAVARWRAEVDGERRLEVASKCDLEPAPSVPGALRVSGATGEGVEALRTALAERVVGGGGAAAAIAVSERHADCLRRALAALERALGAAAALELASAELRLAAEALAEVVGVDASAELLDAVFARFCIGK
jgi:tRNA modification GTPase